MSGNTVLPAHDTRFAFAASCPPEIYVPGRVDQVERVHLPVRPLIPHASLVELDGDASLPLQVHTVQKLRL